RRAAHPPLFPYTTLFRSPILGERPTNLRQRQEPAANLRRIVHVGRPFEQFDQPPRQPGAHAPQLGERPAGGGHVERLLRPPEHGDRKSTRLNSSHRTISY